MLQERLSSDLGIYKYIDENEDGFRSRLLYTAIHSWIYASLMQSGVDKDEAAGIDILSSASRISTILDDFLKVFRECEEFFLTTYKGNTISSKQAISKLIIKLYKYNAIGRISSRRYVNIPEIINSIGDMFLCRGGNNFATADVGYLHIGVGRWCKQINEGVKTSDMKIVVGFYDQDIRKWTYNHMKEVKWENTELQSSLKVYMPGCQHSYKKWLDYSEFLISDKLFTIAMDRYYRFYFIQKQGVGVRTAMINHWYFASQELNRLLFGIDIIFKKQIEVSFEKQSDHVKLANLPLLPLYEQAMLSYCGWPVNRCDDCFNYIIDIKTWPIVYKMLENVGIILKGKVMDSYTVLNTHAALKGKLIDYIKTQYLMNSDLLYDSIANQIEEKDSVCREPFLEATPAYEKGKRGLDGFNLNSDIKVFLKDLAKYNLGVFNSPYIHQQNSIEEFKRGRELLVTTGTGSGKTECFMWPMLCKMAEESKTQSWEKEGVRTLIIYPMNALVADQVGRLRKILSPESEFKKVFKRVSGKDVRLPKFGMYTGRTPYPGDSNPKKSRDFGKMLRTEYTNKDDSVKKKLKELGKWPSKHDLDGFADDLYDDTWISRDNSLDMELLTRHEIQRTCPDILITNYCMLEYMLIRPIENVIWEKTRKWLNETPDNKLLIVLDEAHMYRGAPGGEIALLIRRLINRLGVARNKFQFILTSASMPQDKDDELRKFVVDLTAADEEKISIIRGIPEHIEEGYEGTHKDAQFFSQVSVEKLYSNPDQYTEIKKLADSMNWEMNEMNYKSQLYEMLIELPFMRVLLKECRSRACTIDELVPIIFPRTDRAIAEKAIEVLIVLGATAIKNDVFLLPMRSHIFMRGIRTAYMCINPDCPNHVNGDGLRVGNILINKKQLRCKKCGCLNFEIFVDRRCNGIFIRGYQSRLSDTNILWNVVDPLIVNNFNETDIYLVPNNIDREQLTKLRNMGEMGYLIANTGEFIPTISKMEDIKGIRVVRSDINGFSTCPSCNKPRLHLNTLSTRGNEPFSNVVFEQLWRQAPKNVSEELPNGGRKVLLFSDSRQRAARLARDMTIAADGDTGRKVLLKAAQLLLQWSEKTGQEISLDDLYGLFVQIVNDKKLSFFYGDGKEILEKDLMKYKRRFTQNNDISRIISRFRGTRPELYSQQLLRQLTDSFQSLHDLALGYLSISNKLDDDLLELSEDTSLEVNDLRKILQSWIAYVIVNDKAIGTNISDDVRKNISQHVQQRILFGLERISFTRVVKKILLDNGLAENQLEKIVLWIEDFLTDTMNADGNNRRYIKQDAIVLRVEHDKEWVRCSRCCSVFKHTLYDRCIFCGSSNVSILDDNHIKRMNFWRDSVIDVLKKNDDCEIHSVDIAEHTAQLNYVDKEEKALATTEEYEMLFQDFIDSEGKRPVDMLSCTTTMEVGIDIGSLTAIGMRNVPPSRNNYQQRAGRAGRKSSSVSTVVTYTEDGPHDSWYFSHPNDIVRGTPRTPWIDIYNIKLIKRHLNMIALSKYFRLFAPNMSVDTVYANEFFLGEDHPSIRKFSEWVRDDFRFDKSDIDSLIPNNFITIEDSFYEQLANEMICLADHASKDPNVLIVPQEVEDSTSRLYLPRALDKLYKEGVLPTYSFPRDVVNYWIEDSYGKIEEKPQRAIEIALSDYAPGRTLVVNKKTYLSGGIYNHFNRRHKNAERKYAAAEPWLALEEYRGLYYYCQRCGWMSRSQPENGICPLCGFGITANSIIKPWGFAPKEGKNIPEVQDNQVYSSSSAPQYSTTPDTTDMDSVEGVAHLRIKPRKDQNLMVVNRGPEDSGFRICSLCGAAEPSSEELNNENFHLRPYKLWTTDNQKCHGVFIENVSLGYEFLTDLLVLEIPLDRRVINADIFENKNIWLNPAVCTLAEALAKATGIVLDVEAQDIQAGYRFRVGDENIFYADVYLYDKLVSGAGYSTIAARSITEILNKVRDILVNCTCDDSCPNCLQHFQNQWIQPLLNRKLALQLVDWFMYDKVCEPIPLNRQKTMLSGLNDLLKETQKGLIQFELDKPHKIIYSDKEAEIIVYPCMWSNSRLVDHNIVYLPDRIVENGLPYAFDMVEEFLVNRNQTDEFSKET